MPGLAQGLKIGVDVESDPGCAEQNMKSGDARSLLADNDRETLALTHGGDGLKRARVGVGRKARNHTHTPEFL